MADYIRPSIVCDLRLPEKFTNNEARQILRYMQRHAALEDRPHLEQDGSLRTAQAVFDRAVDRMLSINLVADAIDNGAGKRTIADALRACARRKMDGSAHAYFNTNSDYLRMVVERIFVCRDGKWETALGVTSSTAALFRARGERGAREMFDGWLNAGYSLDDFVDILRRLGEHILARNIGLGDKTVPNVSPTPLLRAAHSAPTDEACAFAPIDEDEEPAEPTLGDLVQRVPTPKSFARVCLGLSEDRALHRWLETQGLTRGEFIESLRATKTPAIVELADAWSERLAHAMAGAAPADDVDKDEHDVCAALRTLFTQHKVFRGKQAANKLDRAIGVLTSDAVGVYELADAKLLRFEYLQSLGAFNVSEARKAEQAFSTLSE